MKNSNSVSREMLNRFTKSRTGAGKKHLCNAIFSNLFLSIDGYATPCCMNQRFKLGNYTGQSIDEIWKSDAVKEFRAMILQNVFPVGCEQCSELFMAGNFRSLQIRQYDRYSTKGRIERLEFQTSNKCNLACDMCSGQLSSSVSAKRENYNKITDNTIPLDEPSFRAVLKGLKEAQFSGGEPFMIDFYQRIWDFLIEFNKNCTISVQTNGTVYNDEISKLIRKGNFHINVSADSIIPGKYESIRVNAGFEKTMVNIEKFRAYMVERNRTMSVAVCVMPQNYTEIPSIIEYCNKNEFEILFNTVSFPARNSLWLLSTSEIETILNFLSASSLSAGNRTAKSNNIVYNEYLKYISDLAQKIRKFDLEKPESADSRVISELAFSVVSKLKNAAVLRACENDQLYINRISEFEELIRQEPDTNRKRISLMVMNHYNDNLLLSNLLREDRSSLKKILSRLSVIASVK